ncbi:hypothetical protein BH23BAC3_BH23BAC3_04110 [soil metagenome]
MKKNDEYTQNQHHKQENNQLCQVKDSAYFSPSLLLIEPF